ncbi:MAG: hypothetical protein IRZ31_19350 [Thermogemmatispora sp.]|nr:hypothetical protein [Thermogemmatispora sp.]MBX5459056.1 hypothetical protein [Thermogemmatispora sp.]
MARVVPTRRARLDAPTRAISPKISRRCVRSGKRLDQKGVFALLRGR